MLHLKKIAKFWLPPILWAGIIFTFSSFPTITTTQFFLGDFLLKKTAHFVEYGILASLLYRALISSDVRKKEAMLFSVLIAIIYGITDEFHQSFTPGREPRLRDVVIDTTGAIIFIYGFVNNLNKMPKFVQNLYNTLEIKI